MVSTACLRSSQRTRSADNSASAEARDCSICLAVDLSFTVSRSRMAAPSISISLLGKPSSALADKKAVSIGRSSVSSCRTVATGAIRSFIVAKMRSSRTNKLFSLRRSSRPASSNRFCVSSRLGSKPNLSSIIFISRCASAIRPRDRSNSRRNLDFCAPVFGSRSTKRSSNSVSFSRLLVSSEISC